MQSSNQRIDPLESELELGIGRQGQTAPQRMVSETVFPSMKDTEVVYVFGNTHEDS
jgi:hypothetical protein